jgi:putative tryptophan/tyrosine transport system substrate-binding protein
MRRREFIAGLGSAAVWPVATQAQRAALPAIGYFSFGSLESTPEIVTAFRRGLSDTGYVEGRNLSIEYRWAQDDLDRLPGLADDLARRQVAVIVAMGTPVALAAKSATKLIPIVFSIGADPVEVGLVASLSRPGGNLTGMSILLATVATKRLQLLHEVVPRAKSIALLVNPADPAIAEPFTKEMQLSAHSLGTPLVMLNATSESEIDAAFANLASKPADGLVVGGHSLFFTRTDQLVALAARDRVPAIYPWREGAAAGGLMSYGTDRLQAFRQVGAYVGRILNGEKPADLPVQQSTKVELILNLKTAKALGLTIPETLLATADEVIQ